MRMVAVHADGRGAVSEHFTHVAEAYERYWSAALLPANQHLLAQLPLADARAVLDVGAGVGTLYPTLAAATDARIVLTDRAAGMIARAPDAAVRLVADADRLPFPDDTFDIATLMFMLQYLPDPQATLAEVRRVLRPGGRVGLLVWGQTALPQAQRLWAAALDDAVGAVPGSEQLATYYDAMDTAAKVGAVLTGAGYDEVDVHAVPWSDRPDLDLFVVRQQTLGVNGRRLRALDEAARTAFVQHITRELSALPPEAFVDNSEVLAGIARA